jgi:hypothetical protein
MASRFARDLGDMPPEFRTILESWGSGAGIGLGLIVGFFVMLCVSSVFGMLGGLFGALIFKKSQPPVVPPPIPQ